MHVLQASLPPSSLTAPPPLAPPPSPCPPLPWQTYARLFAEEDARYELSYAPFEREQTRQQIHRALSANVYVEDVTGDRYARVHFHHKQSHFCLVRLISALWLT